MYQETLNKVITIIVDELGIDRTSVNENSKIVADLDVNSLELLNVIIAIEEYFGITFEERRLRKLKTVGDIGMYADELRA